MYLLLYKTIFNKIFISKNGLFLSIICLLLQPIESMSVESTYSFFQPIANSEPYVGDMIGTKNQSVADLPIGSNRSLVYVEQNGQPIGDYDLAFTSWFYRLQNLDPIDFPWMVRESDLETYLPMLIEIKNLNYLDPLSGIVQDLSSVKYVALKVESRGCPKVATDLSSETILLEQNHVYKPEQKSFCNYIMLAKVNTREKSPPLVNLVLWWNKGPYPDLIGSTDMRFQRLFNVWGELGNNKIVVDLKGENNFLYWKKSYSLDSKQGQLLVRATNGFPVESSFRVMAELFISPRAVDYYLVDEKSATKKVLLFKHLRERSMKLNQLKYYYKQKLGGHNFRLRCFVRPTVKLRSIEITFPTNQPQGWRAIPSYAVAYRLTYDNIHGPITVEGIKSGQTNISSFAAAALLDQPYYTFTDNKKNQEWLLKELGFGCNVNSISQ